MAKPTCSEAEFIRLFQEYGSPTKLASHLGISVRNVNARRRRIEGVKGIKLVAHAAPITKRVNDIGLSSRDWSVAWDKTDGLSVLVHNPDFTPDDYHTALQETVETVRKLAPKFPPIKHTKPKDGHLPYY
jgi:hypothetical protein